MPNKIERLLGIWDFPLINAVVNSPSSMNSSPKTEPLNKEIGAGDGQDKESVSSDEPVSVEVVLGDELRRVTETSTEDGKVSKIRFGEVSETEEEPPSLKGIERAGVKQQSQNTTEDVVERESLFFFEVNDKTAKSTFRPENKRQIDRDFPLRTSGEISTILVIAEDNTFSSTLVLDGDKVLDDKAWSDIDNLSGELSHIETEARQDGKYVLSINDYPFNETIDFSISPNSQTTFNLIRVEIIEDEYTKGPQG